MFEEATKPAEDIPRRAAVFGRKSGLFNFVVPWDDIIESLPQENAE
jgi:hypothetical protein